jgi:hypothetical protein
MSSKSLTTLESDSGDSSISNKKETRSTNPPRFNKVTIFEFPISIGDNPAAREGCPVALSQHCVFRETLDIDEYEKMREGYRRKSSKNLYLPVEDRAAMLLSRGYSLDKIVRRVLEMEEIKKSRSESLKMNGWDRLNIAIDNAGKTLRKLNLNKKPKGDKPNEIPARMA